MKSCAGSADRMGDGVTTLESHDDDEEEEDDDQVQLATTRRNRTNSEAEASFFGLLGWNTIVAPVSQPRHHN